MIEAEPPLFLPVLLGTARAERLSEHVARFVLERVRTLPGVETELVDIREIPLSTRGAGEDLKDPEFSRLCQRADGLVLVVPEYNHGYPGLLKHLLDTNLKEYIHKAAGVVGVSAGPFGGARAIENLLPVLRELGLVTIFWDGNFSHVRTLFDETGNLKDPDTWSRRLEKFLKELVWMSTVLRYGRLHVSLG
jgi:NAD(P)H-dependent FMN reductase